MLNQVILKGNLGSAPEFKKTQDGRDVVFFSMATSFNWKDLEGEWNTHVDWHKITVFKDSTIRWLKDILRKGDTVYVMGRLMNRERTDNLGRRHVETQVVVTDRFGKVEHIRSKSLPELEENEDPLNETTHEHLSERQITNPQHEGNHHE